MYNRGMYIKVVVAAGAKQDSLTMTSETRLSVSVKAPAKQNLANSRVLELVAAHFGVSKKKVRIISGHHSPSKMLSVDV